MFSVAPVSLCFNFHFLCQFNALLAIAGSSPWESFHLPRHFITSHTTHLCCFRPLVAEESLPSPRWLQAPSSALEHLGLFGNDFICHFFFWVQHKRAVIIQCWKSQQKKPKGSGGLDLICPFRQPEERTRTAAPTWERLHWDCCVYEMGSAFLTSTQTQQHPWCSVLLPEVCAPTTFRGNEILVKALCIWICIQGQQIFDRGTNIFILQKGLKRSEIIFHRSLNQIEGKMWNLRPQLIITILILCFFFPPLEFIYLPHFGRICFCFVSFLRQKMSQIDRHKGVIRQTLLLSTYILEFCWGYLESQRT